MITSAHTQWNAWLAKILGCFIFGRLIKTPTTIERHTHNEWNGNCSSEEFARAHLHNTESSRKSMRCESKAVSGCVSHQIQINQRYLDTYEFVYMHVRARVCAIVLFSASSSTTFCANESESKATYANESDTWYVTKFNLEMNARLVFRTTYESI